MDAISLISNKHQKHREGENASSIKLDDLPVEILEEIISNLPIKDAVRTSVLSRRWAKLWMGVTKIELVEEAYDRRQQFTDFVVKLLAVFNPSCLRNFSLVCDVREDTPQVNRWLSGFIKPKVQELRLHFERVEEQLVFPDHLFTSNSLTHFHLSMPHVINLPSFIYFRSLRTLTLRHVIFPDTSPTQELFSSCPSLERLTLIDCSWKNVRAVCIVSPSLQTLTIREWKDEDDDSVKSDDENDAVGQNVPTYCKIVITGSNLKTFSYDGDLLNDYFLYSTTITDGTVEVHPPPYNLVDAGHFVLKLLQALSNVGKLSVTDFAAETLCRASFLIPRLPLFNNLVQLRVAAVAAVNLACDALLTILRNSPILKAVDFIMGVALHKISVNHIGPLPTCLATNLKTIRIYGFRGIEEEMIAIKFLLQSTPVLDAFCLYRNAYDIIDFDVGSERLNMLYKKIAQFPRASADCKMYFE